MLQQSKVNRQHLRLAKLPAIQLAQPDQQQQYQQQGAAQADTFNTMLTNLVHSRTLASKARTVGMLPLLLAVHLALLHLVST